VQRKKKWKKNQARRLQCLINTGSRRVCATQRSRLDARATGAIRHPGHQRVLLLQLCSSISPLLTKKKPKLDKRERDTRRDSQAVLLTQNPLPVFSLIPDSLFKLLFFLFISYNTFITQIKRQNKRHRMLSDCNCTRKWQVKGESEQEQRMKSV
jgi:hypothetical protein